MKAVLLQTGLQGREMCQKPPWGINAFLLEVRLTEWDATAVPRIDPSRRTFLKTVSLLSASAVPAFAAARTAPPLKAAVIGHTGRGDYGHGLERIFEGRPGIELVAIADPDPIGLERTAKALGGPRSYSNWKLMLEREQPRLVSIAMRHSRLHHEIAMGCLRAGAHIYVEKPFVMFPAEADEVLGEAQQRHRRIGVAHTLRASAAARNLRQALSEGVFGPLLEIRAHGKQDPRAGGEDMIVLGSHLFDLMRMFAGTPVACSARVLHQGRPIRLEDRRTVKDDVGWVAGDDISALFEFPNGVSGSFRSRAEARATSGPWGLELICAKGAVRFVFDVSPHVFVRSEMQWGPEGASAQWKPLDPSVIQTVPKSIHPVTDWLDAIEEGRDPECSGSNGAWAVEMAMGVYESALQGRRVLFPLVNRRHPLESA